LTLDEDLSIAENIIAADPDGYNIIYSSYPFGSANSIIREHGADVYIRRNKISFERRQGESYMSLYLKASISVFSDLKV